MSIIRIFAQRNRHGFLRIMFGYLAVVLVLTACGTSSGPAAGGGGGPVTMGVLSCFTGTLASLGQAMLQGSQVAQKAINEAGASSEGS